MSVIVRAKKKRAAPLQARGVRRVEAILDAASTLLGEVGYDALTLTAVAERSDSAIPSLYRFFANKDELMDALADRIALRIRSLTEATFDEALPASVGTFVNNVVEQFAKVAIEYPGLTEIAGRPEGRHQSITVEVAARLEAIVASRAPRIAAGERANIVRMTMAIVNCGVRLIVQDSKNRRRAAMTELKTVLTAYLETRLTAI